MSAAEPIDECTVIDEPGDYEVTQDLNTTGTCLVVDADDVTLSGGDHVLQGVDIDDDDYGLAVTNRENVSVTNLTVQGWDHVGADDVSGGVLLYNVTDTHVENVTTVGNTEGVVLFETENVSVEAVDAVSNYQTGILAIASEEAVLANVTATGSDSVGIGVLESEAITLADAVANENGDAGIAVVENSVETSITDAHVEANTDAGIGILDSAETTVENTTATWNDNIGISIDDATDTTVTESTVSENAVGGIAVANESAGATIEATTAADNLEWDVGTVNSTGVLAQDLDLGNSTATDTTISFSAANVTLTGVSAEPVANPAADPVDRYVDVDQLEPTASLDLSIHYVPGDVEDLEEDSLAIWGLDEDDWEPVPNSSVDTTAAVVTATLEDPDAVFGVFGEESVEEEIVYEKTLSADGSIHTVGVPGPTAGTVGDFFPAGTDGVGAVYAYDDSGWELVTDFDRSPEALDALVLVTHDTGDNVPLEVIIEPNTTADDRTMDAGWNFVAAPAFTDTEESFGVESALLTLDQFSHLESTEYDSVDKFDSYVLGATDWGADPGEVNPFAGYYVFFEEPGTLSPVLTDVDDRTAADQLLGLE